MALGGRSNLSVSYPEVLSEVSKLLGLLTRDKDSTKQVVEKIVQQGGGLSRTLVTAMEEHPEDSMFHRSMFSALQRPLEHHPLGTRNFVEDNGIEAVLGAMSKHQRDAGIHLHGCRILHLLLSNDDDDGKYQRLIREAGRMVAVGSAMHFHRENEDVKREAEKAMRTLLA